MVLGIIIFQGIIFLVLIFLLRHFMQGHVTGAVGHLERMNEELMKQQSELKEKIAVAEKEYQSKMAKIQQEVTSRQNQVRQEANQTLEESRTQAMEERERLIKEALATREKMRQEIMSEMEEKSIQYSKDIIGEFISGDLRKVVHEVLVEQAIQGFDQVKPGQYKIDAEHAELVVAEPLSTELKTKFRKKIKEKMDRDVVFKEETDPALIGGLILRFGTFIIDGSLVHRLKDAAAKLKKENVRKYQGKT